MQILATRPNQPVLNAHSRKNQVSFEKLHMDPDMFNIHDDHCPMILESLDKVKKLAANDEIVIKHIPWGIFRVSVIKDFESGLKIPMIASSQKSAEEIASEGGLAKFAESIQTRLSERMKSLLEIFDETDLIKKDTARKELSENSEMAISVLKTLPEIDNKFNEAVASNLQKTQEEIVAKQAKEKFINKFLPVNSEN